MRRPVRFERIERYDRGHVHVRHVNDAQLRRPIGICLASTLTCRGLLLRGMVKQAAVQAASRVTS